MFYLSHTVSNLYATSVNVVEKMDHVEMCVNRDQEIITHSGPIWREQYEDRLLWEIWDLRPEIKARSIFLENSFFSFSIVIYILMAR